MTSKEYVLGWDMWFDDGADEPKHFHCESMADLEGLPQDGLQAWVVHLADGGRYNVTGDVQFVAPHPAGGLIFSGYGSGVSTLSEMRKIVEELPDRFPGAVAFLAKNTTYWIHKQASDAANDSRMK